MLRGTACSLVRVGFAAFLLGFAACSNPTGTKKQHLLEARIVWESLALTDYEFIYRSTPPQTVGYPPALIEVRGGDVTRAFFLESNEELRPVGFRDVPTIDSLFAFVARALESEPDILEVRYDATFGYPQSFHFEYRVDTERRVLVSGRLSRAARTGGLHR